MIAVSATLIALLLACCFAGVGDLLVRRRSDDLVKWNQSFLIGLSVTAIAFVPLSILLPGHALVFTVLCLIVVGSLGIRQSLRPPSLRSTREARAALHNDRWSFAFLVVIGMLFVQFILQNTRLSYLWDGYQIWGTKALVMYQHGALGKQWVAPGEQERLVSYPHMVPLYEALVAKVQGVFDWEALKPVFGLFYLSLLVSTFHAARFLVSRRIALAATALLALLPAVSTRCSVGGYADMPQSALVAGAVAALLESCLLAGGGWRSPAPWLIGGLMLVKSEGMLLAVIASTTVVVCWRLVPPTGVLARFCRYRGAIAVVIGCLATRWLSIIWLQSQDPTYGPLDRTHFARAYENLLLVPRTCGQQMLNVSEWGLFWPAFALAAITVSLTGTWRERAVVGGTSAALAAYASIFYLTNWDVSLHINQAFNRLLVQVAPAAALAIGVAYARLRADRFPPEN
jgi:hypothetical protein